MKKTILVVGGAGYIGSAAVDSLINNGHKVIVFDDFSTGQKDKISNDAEVLEGSLTNLDVLDKVFQEYQFDAVMHFAAKKAVGESEINPSLYFKTNVIGSFNLLLMMEKYEVPQIIFSSTAAVYSPSLTNDSISERHPIAPISVYGTTKMIVENMIEAYARTGKIEQFSILRYFNVAGDVGLNYQEKNPQNVFPIIASKLNNNEPFEIFGTDYDTKDGTCVRDYIHLLDLIDGHVKALETEKSGVFNLGTSNGFSVRELVNAFEQVSGKLIKVVESPRRPGDPAVVVADSALAKQELGWEAKYTLKNMVEDTLRVYG